MANPNEDQRKADEARRASQVEQNKARSEPLVGRPSSPSDDAAKAAEARNVKVQDPKPSPGKTSEIGGEFRNEANPRRGDPKPGTTREEQPLPVDIFPKDGPTEITVEKLWGGGEHRKAAEKCVGNNANLGKLLKAYPQDEALINETITNVTFDNARSA